MGKNKIAANRRRLLHEIVNVSPVWMVAIFFCLKISWAWLLAFVGAYGVAQLITRITVSFFAEDTSPTPLSLVRILFTWLLIVALNIGCSLLMGILPFSITVNYILLTLLDILTATLLSVWTIKW